MNCDPGIIFLGICERASCVVDKNTNVLKWNIIGLKHIILSPINLFPLSDLTLGFAFDKNIIKDGTKIIITNEEERGVAYLNLDFRTVIPTI